MSFRYYCSAFFLSSVLGVTFKAGLDDGGSFIHKPTFTWGWRTMCLLCDGLSLHYMYCIFLFSLFFSRLSSPLQSTAASDAGGGGGGGRSPSPPTLPPRQVNPSSHSLPKYFCKICIANHFPQFLHYTRWTLHIIYRYAEPQDYSEPQDSTSSVENDTSEEVAARKKR